MCRDKKVVAILYYLKNVDKIALSDIIIILNERN